LDQDKHWIVKLGKDLLKDIVNLHQRKAYNLQSEEELDRIQGKYPLLCNQYRKVVFD